MDSRRQLDSQNVGNESALMRLTVLSQGFSDELQFFLADIPDSSGLERIYTKREEIGGLREKARL